MRNTIPDSVREARRVRDGVERILYSASSEGEYDVEKERFLWSACCVLPHSAPYRLDLEKRLAEYTIMSRGY